MFSEQHRRVIYNLICMTFCKDVTPIYGWSQPSRMLTELTLPRDNEKVLISQGSRVTSLFTLSGAQRILVVVLLPDRS